MQPVTFKLTAADLVDARLYVHGRLPLVRALRLLLSAIAVASALGIAFLGYRGNWSGATDIAPMLVISLGLLAWGFVGTRWLAPPSARKQIKSNKSLQGEVAVSWDGEGMSLTSSHGQSRWPWADFHKWQESPGGLLLWQDNTIFFYLPKRSLANDQRAEVRAALTSALGKPRR